MSEAPSWAVRDETPAPVAQGLGRAAKTAALLATARDLQSAAVDEALDLSGPK